MSRGSETLIYYFDECNNITSDTFINVCYAFIHMLFFLFVKVHWSEPPSVPGLHLRRPRASKGPRRQAGEAPEPRCRGLGVIR